MREKARISRKLGVPWEQVEELTHAEVDALSDDYREEEEWNNYVEDYRLAWLFCLWANSQTKKGATPMKPSDLVKEPGSAKRKKAVPIEDLSLKFLGVFQRFGASTNGS